MVHILSSASKILANLLEVNSILKDYCGTMRSMNRQWIWSVTNLTKEDILK